MPRQLDCNIILKLDGDPINHVVCGGAKVAGVASISTLGPPITPTHFKVVLEGVVRVHWVTHSKDGNGRTTTNHHSGYDYLANEVQDFTCESLPPVIQQGSTLDLRFDLKWPLMDKKYGGGLLYPGSTANSETENGTYYRLLATLSGKLNGKKKGEANSAFYFKDVPQLAGKFPVVFFPAKGVEEPCLVDEDGQPIMEAPTLHEAVTVNKQVATSSLGLKIKSLKQNFWRPKWWAGFPFRKFNPKISYVTVAGVTTFADLLELQNVELSSSCYQIGKPQKIRLKCVVANNSDPEKDGDHVHPNTITELRLRLNQNWVRNEGKFKPSDDWSESKYEPPDPDPLLSLTRKMLGIDDGPREKFTGPDGEKYMPIPWRKANNIVIATCSDISISPGDQQTVEFIAELPAFVSLKNRHGLGSINLEPSLPCSLVTCRWHFLDVEAKLHGPRARKSTIKGRDGRIHIPFWVVAPNHDDTARTYLARISKATGVQFST
eukprot:UC4_evm1s1122